MNAERFEAFLAELYTDSAARQRFLADPLGAARRAGLAEEQCAALSQIDRVGLQLAADSFAKKRAAAKQRRG
ncbi:MAG: hypothetical protein FJ143_11260 [Deltaproteobacteria bacterium]|nr:hypothetical protein [Deltaproteobacteria bacterium]